MLEDFLTKVGAVTEEEFAPSLSSSSSIVNNPHKGKARVIGAKKPLDKVAL
ncbi:hypothetical protein Fmac_001883 [Flemingia macrophylla]|uniref:Uncharacterized protein n=1 Tax=Flemingia macrophylla TaxID=520843 RepID=A0ABD1NK23_9FABA